MQLRLFGWEWLFLNRKWLASASSPSYPAKTQIKVAFAGRLGMIFKCEASLPIGRAQLTGGISRIDVAQGCIRIYESQLPLGDEG